MHTHTLHVFDTLPAGPTSQVDQGLDLANSAAAPLQDVRPLACFAQSADQATVGGAVGRTWGHCCELQQLWVDPAQRQQGIASALLALFEARARQRSCQLCYLETFSFQAPGFYQKQGYQVQAELAGFPDGIVKYLMSKVLLAP
ncbi:MAG: GNAT family N-acetyltransferase [Chitinimonas sp.]|nr:GNAT family N-acetyltransferase [Chitinimonas sp.]